MSKYCCGMMQILKRKTTRSKLGYANKSHTHEHNDSYADGTKKRLEGIDGGGERRQVDKHSETGKGSVLGMSLISQSVIIEPAAANVNSETRKMLKNKEHEPCRHGSHTQEHNGCSIPKEMEAVKKQVGTDSGGERGPVDAKESLTAEDLICGEASRQGNLDLSNRLLRPREYSHEAADFYRNEYERITRNFCENKPTLENWVESWPKENWGQSGYYYLNVSAHYCSKKLLGRYGVIVRDPHGRPVIASAKVSRGESFYYYVLDGVNAALSLALNHGVYNLDLRWNSEFLDDRLSIVFSQIYKGAYRSCPANPTCDQVCVICLNLYMGFEGTEYIKSLYPLLVEFLRKRSEIMARGEYFSLGAIGRKFNKAAYCLGRQHEMEHLNKPASTEKMYEPVTFSDELKSILWEDCFVGNIKKLGGSPKYAEQLFSSYERPGLFGDHTTSSVIIDK